LLDKIVEAERQILAKIEAEKKKCDDRIEEARKNADDRIAKERAIMIEQCERLVREAEEAAGKRAAGIMEAANQRADKLKGLPDEALQKIVIACINRILPGGAP